MTITEYVRQLAEVLTRQEDLSDAEARDILYELALRIYALLLRELPAGRFERYMAWPRIRRLLMPDLLYANDRIQQILFSRLVAAERVVQAPVAELVGVPPNALTTRPVPELLDTTRVSGQAISQMFVASARTGMTPFVLQLLSMLERTVMASFFQDSPTVEVAQRVIGVRTRAGQQVPVVTKGTVANNWRERFRSITAAAIWSTVTPAITRALATTPAGVTGTASAQWRWNAVLDPKTCPVCRPLHQTVAASPNTFPRGAPPLHPRCRCVVVPEWVTT